MCPPPFFLQFKSLQRVISFGSLLSTARRMGEGTFLFLFNFNIQKVFHYYCINNNHTN